MSHYIPRVPPQIRGLLWYCFSSFFTPPPRYLHLPSKVLTCCHITSSYLPSLSQGPPLSQEKVKQPDLEQAQVSAAEPKPALCDDFWTQSGETIGTLFNVCCPEQVQM